MIKLLLVDDHSIIRDGLKALFHLSAPSIKVVAEAPSGKEALHCLSLQPIDVVLMDMNMPDMDGLDTTKYIVRDYPHIKVLILSMVDNKHLIAKAFQVGAHGYILKSINEKELVQAIEAVYKEDWNAVTGTDIFGYQGNGGVANYPAPNAMSPMAGLKKDKVRDSLHIRNFALSKREMEVLRHIVKGLTNTEMGEKLFVSRRTIENHRQSLLLKTGCTNTAALIYYASRHHLLD